MANKKVDEAAGAKAHGGLTAEKKGAPKGTEPLDASHLRPLSEGVLRMSGLHGGEDKHGNVRDTRGLLEGAEDLDPNTLPSDELHVRLSRLEWKHKGVIERNVLSGGRVSMRFIYGDGDVTTGVGDSTVKAAEALFEKMGGTK